MDETVIEADAVATAVRSLMAARVTWTGIARRLLPTLAEIAGEAATAKTWPANPRALSGRLRRAAPNLRRVGVAIVFGSRQAKERPITITAAGGRGIRPLRPSSPSSVRRINSSSDDSTGAVTVIDSVMRNPAKSAASDGCDGRDAALSAELADEEAVWTG